MGRLIKAGPTGDIKSEYQVTLVETKYQVTQVEAIIPKIKFSINTVFLLVYPSFCYILQLGEKKNGGMHLFIKTVINSNRNRNATPTQNKKL